MNRRSVFLVSLILIAAPMLIVPIQMSGEEVFVPDPVFDPDAGVDVPTWRVGDFWNYSTEFEITYLTFNIPFSGWMNMSVLTATLDFTYGNSPVYIVNITGNITGKIDIPFLGIHERIYVDLSGYAWHRIQDLSIYRMVTNATISGTQDSLNGDYPFGYEYHPPLEEFDFPLIPGETWNVNVSARTPFGTSGDLIDIDQNYTCSSIEPVTVPAGVFDCYPVNMGGSSVQFYNNTLGNSVKRSLSVDAGGMTINAPFELENYHREPEETVIWTWISSDQPVWAGEQFTINGRLSISNTAVTILFPNGEIAAVKTLIGGQKEFTHTLTSPTDPDNTPTDMDHGSFGILSVVGAMQELDVCTITTKAVDLELLPGALTVEPMVNGTIDDLFACNISITNPSNFVVSNFSIVLRDQTRDTLLAERNGLSLEAHEEIGFEIELNFEVPGEHLLILTVDPEDEIREMNESNNEVEVSFNVSSRPPIVWDLGVQPGDISVDEGKDILFHAVGFRGDDTLPPVTWKVDGDEIQVGPDLNITLNFTGSLSSSGSPYNISCHLDPGSLFEGEDGIRSWILFVTDVDRAPVLNSFSPNVSSLELFEGEHVDLVVNFSDPDEEVVEIVWFLNDQVILKGRDVLNFTASFIGHNSSSSSPIMIKVVGSDPDNSSLNASMEWEIFIADVDRVPIVKIDPEPGNLNLFWNESVSLMVNISDPDNDTLLICWFVDGTVRSIDTAFLFNPGELGLGSGIWSNVTLNVLVGNFEHNYTWRIFIKENVTVVDDTPVPPAGVRIIGPEEGQTFEAGSNVTLEAVHTDTRSVLFTWYLNGSVYSGNVLEIAGLSPGNYSLVLNASTEGPPSGCFITETWFIVLEEQEEQPEIGSDEGGSYWWIFIIIGIVVLLISSILAYMLLAGKNEGRNWEE